MRYLLIILVSFFIINFLMSDLTTIANAIGWLLGPLMLAGIGAGVVWVLKMIADHNG